MNKTNSQTTQAPGLDLLGDIWLAYRLRVISLAKSSAGIGCVALFIYMLHVLHLTL